MGGDNGRRGDGATLPYYSVRVSGRARRVRLVVTEDRGLEVVVPRRFDRRMIPGILQRRSRWIERATTGVEARRRRLELEPPRLPDRIVLPAIAEEWGVEYRSGPGSVVGAIARERPGRDLVVTGDIDDSNACKEALCRWLRRRAERTLVPHLEELGRAHGLMYGRVSVRQQRSRWGSCSRRKTISLNARLLFLPPATVDYVLLHELCHTVEMNHSSRFWALLECHDPECRTHQKLLRRAGDSMPTWLDHEVGELTA